MLLLLVRKCQFFCGNRRLITNPVLRKDCPQHYAQLFEAVCTFLNYLLKNFINIVFPSTSKYLKWPIILA